MRRRLNLDTNRHALHLQNISLLMKNPFTNRKENLTHRIKYFFVIGDFIFPFVKKYLTITNLFPFDL